MPKIATELAAKKVEQLAKRRGRHAVGGCRGLLLQASDGGAASWLLRVIVNGKRRDIGLGSYHDIDLAVARELGRNARKQILQGFDPVADRKQRRAVLRAASAAQKGGLTFDEAAKKCHAAVSAEFRNEKFKNDWLSAVTRYVSPVIGGKLVADVDERDLVDVLEPIWTTKTETASRLRGRIEAILDWATVSKHRTGSNPARWKGNLSHLLPNPKKLIKRRRQHYPALPWNDVPAFMRQLRIRGGVGARALEFAILTASRSNEVRLATWREIDLKAKLWTVPAEHMKGNRDHRVPLTPVAAQLLVSLQRSDGCDLLFPNSKRTALSDMALLKVIRDMHKSSLAAGGSGYFDPVVNRVATPHGTARSSFKDWARNQLGHVDEVSELALAHVNSDETRAAYARDELLPQRTLLMQQWADFLDGTTNKRRQKQRKNQQAHRRVRR
jgi:integrase